jgi:hypothetical protein
MGELHRIRTLGPTKKTGVAKENFFGSMVTLTLPCQLRIRILSEFEAIFENTHKV